MVSSRAYRGLTGWAKARSGLIRAGPSPITADSGHCPVACAREASSTPLEASFLYPRLAATCSLVIPKAANAPYRPCTTEVWIYSSRTTRTYQTCSRHLRTMADPVQRTASPYTDPNVKGPKSQQLSVGLGRSLLQNNKSMAPRSLRDSHMTKKPGLTCSPC